VNKTMLAMHGIQTDYAVLRVQTNQMFMMHATYQTKAKSNES